jgi:hypothetical protein
MGRVCASISRPGFQPAPTVVGLSIGDWVLTYTWWGETVRRGPHSSFRPKTIARRPSISGGKAPANPTLMRHFCGSFGDQNRGAAYPADSPRCAKIARS